MTPSTTTGVTSSERGAPGSVNIHFGRQPRHVAGVDLVERAESIAAQVAVVGGPRAGLGMGHFGEGNSRPDLTAAGLPQGIEAQAAQVGDQVPHLIRGRVRLRHERFLVNDLGHLVLAQAGAASRPCASNCRSKALSFFAMPRMVCPLRSRTVTARYDGAPPRLPAAASGQTRDAARIAQRLLDLSQPALAADVRQIRPQHCRLVL